ncbi:MAG: diguanylate cyclase [candidate division Zixibacteria bacterium]|nr:diguanylate cyclase [candidate division Zixibacteria bacterium]
MAEPELEQLLFIDDCTGTYNRRYFFQRLDEEVARAKRYRRTFALLFVDVDRFKEINDVFGHLAGDEVLRDVAARLRHVVRGVDLVFRYAGDEFATILPETGADEAVVAAERALAEFRRTPVYSSRAKRDLQVTLSVGIAAYPDDAADAQGLLDKADQALLVAKHRGRNMAVDQARASEAEALEERLARPVFCPKMVGREREKRFLKKLWGRAAEGRGGLVNVIGETGVGKTRLVRDFIEFAGFQGAPILEGQSFEEPAGFAYQPFREAVAGFLKTPSKGVRARVTAIPRAYQRELYNVIPELAAFGFDTAPFYELAPEQARLRLFVGFRYLVNALAAEGPVALVLEDIHWAEEGSLSLLRFLINGLTKERVFVVATYRPEEVADRRARAPAPSAALSAIIHDRSVESLKLARLDRGAVADMIRLIFRVPDVAPNFVDFVYGETEGNPLFVEETLKSFYEDGLSPRKFAVEGAPIPADYEVPGSVRGIIQRRLSRLDARTTKVLEAAAALGVDFTAEGVRAAVPINEGYLADILDVCVEHELAVPVPGASDKYRFAHGKIRDEIYRRIGKRRRKRLHEKVGSYLEGRFREGDLSVVADLSWHTFVGEMWEKGLVFARLAGDRAWAAYEAAEALKHYERVAVAATKIGKGGFGDELIRRELVELNTRRGEIYLTQGKFAEAAAALEKAKLAAEEIGDRLSMAKAMNLAGRAYGAAGNERRAVSYLNAALTIFKKLDATADIGRALYNLGEYRRRTFDLPKATSYFHMAEAIADKGGDKNLLMMGAEGLGSIASARGDFRSATKYYRRGLKLAREAGDRGGEAAARADLGLASFRRGKFKEALRHFNEALAMARGSGNKPVTASILVGLGAAKYYGDDIKTSIDYLERALTIAQETGDGRLEGEVRYGRALARFRRGDFAAALEELKVASRLARRAGDKYRQYLCQLALAVAQAEAGRSASAKQYLRQATRSSGALPSFNVASRYAYASGRVALAGGDDGAAYREFAAAARATKKSSEPYLLLEAQLWLALAHAAGGRLKRAERAAARARELVGRVPGRRPTALLCHVDGLIAAAGGDRARAARRFRKAIDVLTATDALAAAKVRADFGAYLAGAGETQRAQPLLAAAGRCFDALGNKKKAGGLRTIARKEGERAARKK